MALKLTFSIAIAAGVAFVAKPRIEEWLHRRSLDRQAERLAKKQLKCINQYCREASDELIVGEEMEEDVVEPPTPIALETPQENWVPTGRLVDGFEEVGPPPQLEVEPQAVRVSQKKQKLPKKGLPYSTRVGFEARAQVGLLDRTKANYLVYQRICRDIMKEHGVRTTHIAALLPAAISAAFVPSDTDIISSRAISSKFTTQRHKLLGGVRGC
jgi:hypothetical protein